MEIIINIIIRDDELIRIKGRITSVDSIFVFVVTIEINSELLEFR